MRTAKLSAFVALLRLACAVADPLSCTPANPANVTSYTGIRFAAYNGRFREASLIQDVVYDTSAGSYGPICPQSATNVFQLLDQNCTSVVEAEDCLFLQVHAPKERSPRTSYPVVFYIHGGSFTVGASQLSIYDPRELVRQENVVVVQANYRLQGLGFASFESDAMKKAGYSDNLAVRDQFLALEWVQKNIALFGGDPHSVTIHGESAGASMVLALLAANHPNKANLIHGAVSVSGPIQIRGPTNHELSLLFCDTYKMAVELGHITTNTSDSHCPTISIACWLVSPQKFPQMAACIEAVPVADYMSIIAQVAQDDSLLHPLRAPYAFSPTHDTTLLPSNLYYAFQFNQGVLDVPLVFVHNHLEFGFAMTMLAGQGGSAFISQFRSFLRGEPAGIDAICHLVFTDGLECSLIVQAAQSLTPKALVKFIHISLFRLLGIGRLGTQDNIYDEYLAVYSKDVELYPEFLLLKVSGDRAFSCSNVETAKGLFKHHSRTSPVYLANVTMVSGCTQWAPPNSSNPASYCAGPGDDAVTLCNRYACHGDDIMVTLNSWERMQCNTCDIYPGAQRQSRRMMHYFSRLSTKHSNSSDLSEEERIPSWTSLQDGFGQLEIDNVNGRAVRQVPSELCHWFTDAHTQ